MQCNSCKRRFGVAAPRNHLNGLTSQVLKSRNRVSHCQERELQTDTIRKKAVMHAVDMGWNWRYCSELRHCYEFKVREKHRCKYVYTSV